MYLAWRLRIGQCGMHKSSWSLFMFVLWKKWSHALFAYKPCESIYDQILCACCLRILFHFPFPTFGSLRPKQEAIFSVCFQLRRIQSFPWSEPRGPEIHELETHNVALLKLLQAVTYSHILYTSCMHLTRIILCTLFRSCPLLQKHKLPFKWSVVSSKCPALCQKTLGSSRGKRVSCTCTPKMNRIGKTYILLILIRKLHAKTPSNIIQTWNVWTWRKKTHPLSTHPLNHCLGFASWPQSAWQHQSAKAKAISACNRSVPRKLPWPQILGRYISKGVLLQGFQFLHRKRSRKNRGSKISMDPPWG